MDTQILERFAAKAANPIVGALARWQTRKCARYESTILQASDGFSMISEADARTLRRNFPELEPVVVGAGVDLDRYSVPWDDRESETLCHVGSLDGLVKVSGVMWFCREVLPLVRRRHPNVVLELVGRGPARAFRGLPGVRWIGPVIDERPYLWRGRVFIAPQLMGSGVRLKMLTAMATANAIVCTSVACEGIAVVDGEHALIRERPGAFADAVADLLNSPERARRLGLRARRLVEERYDWRAVGRELASHLAVAAGNRRSSDVLPRRVACVGYRREAADAMKDGREGIGRLPFRSC